MKIKEREKMLSTPQVAEALGVHLRTVQLWLRQGRLPGVKLGPRLWRVKESDVRQIQEEGLPVTKKAERPS